MRASSILCGSKKSLLEFHAPFLSLLRSFDAKQSSRGTVSYEMRSVGKQQVAVLKIENAAKRGSIDAHMMLQLASAVDNLEKATENDEPNAPVGLILCSDQNFFCSGLDLNLAKNCINTPKIGASMCEFMTDTLNRLRKSSCISVTVISGPAIGGGSELVLSTDYRIMHSHQEIFIQSVHARIGAAPGWGGAARFISIVGQRHALRILGASVKVHAHEAQRIGLVDELFERKKEADGTISSDIEAGLRFLEPFTNQTYPGSVRGMKKIVAAADTGAAESIAAVEAKVFEGRWFGPDNRNALGLPTV